MMSILQESDISRKVTICLSLYSSAFSYWRTKLVWSSTSLLCLKGEVVIQRAHLEWRQCNHLGWGSRAHPKYVLLTQHCDLSAIWMPSSNIICITYLHRLSKDPVIIKYHPCTSLIHISFLISSSLMSVVYVFTITLISNLLVSSHWLYTIWRIAYVFSVRSCAFTFKSMWNDSQQTLWSRQKLARASYSLSIEKESYRQAVMIRWNCCHVEMKWGCTSNKYETQQQMNHAYDVQ